VTYEEHAREFYRRLGEALPTAGERIDFEKQVERARLAVLDGGHDTFSFEEFPDELRVSGDAIECLYADADGFDVNVIVHLVGGLLSFAERFRYVGAIMTWPPPPDTPLRLSSD
jgi:hypothetical protein